MTVELKLVGIEDSSRSSTGGRTRLTLNLPASRAPADLLRNAGIEVTPGLLLLSADSVIPLARWEEPVLADGDRLTLLLAIEGG